VAILGVKDGQWRTWGSRNGVLGSGCQFCISYEGIVVQDKAYQRPIVECLDFDFSSSDIVGTVYNLACLIPSRTPLLMDFKNRSMLQ
jgi:hypothetical protein